MPVGFVVIGINYQLLWLAALLWAPLGEESKLPPIFSLESASLAGLSPDIRLRLEQAHSQARTDPSDAAACGRLAQLLEAYEQYALAATCYRRAALLDPKSFRWAYYLGRLQRWIGDSAKATVTLRQAIRLDPDYFAARLKLAESLLAAGHGQESEQMYRQLLQSDERSASAHFGLGRAQAAQGNLSAAAESYRTACRLFPEYGAAHYALALAYRDLGRPDQSKQEIVLFERSRGRAPLLPDPLMEAIEALKEGKEIHFRQGLRQQRAGDLPGAISEYEQVLRADPDDARAHGNLLAAYLNLGNFEKAEAHYYAAVYNDPHHYESHHNFGLLRYRQGRLGEAAQAFEKVVEINPLHAESHSNLAFLLAAQGRMDEAVVHFRQALDNQPNLRSAHLGIGKILLSQGKSSQALEHLHKTLAPEDAETPRFLHTLAAAYASLGDLGKATHYGEKARQQALFFGQPELVAQIEALLKEVNQTGSRR